MPSANVRNRDDQQSPQGRHNKKRRVFLSSSDGSEDDAATSNSKYARNKESDPPFEKPLLGPNQKASPKSNQTSSPHLIQKPSSRSIQKSLPQSIEKPSPRPNQKSSLQPNPKPSSQLKHKFLPGKSCSQSVYKPSPLSQGFLPGKPSPQSKQKPSSLGQRGPPRPNQKTPTPRQDQKPSTQLSQKPPPPSNQKSSPRPTQKKVSPEPDKEPLSLFAPRVTPWALSAPSQELRPLLRQWSIPTPKRKSDNAHNGEDKDELNSTPQTPVPLSKRDASILITENDAEGARKAGSDIDILDANVEESSSSDDELFVTQKDNYDIDNLDANEERNIQSDKDSGYSESNSSDFVADDGLVVSLRRSRRIKAARAGPDKNNRGTAKRDVTAGSREGSEKEWGAAVKQLDEKLDTLDKRISHLHVMIAKDQKAPDDEGETYRENLELKTRKLDLAKRRIDLEEQRLELEKANSTRLHQVIRDLSSFVNDLQSRRSKTPPLNRQHKESGVSTKHGRVDSAPGECDNVR